MRKEYQMSQRQYETIRAEYLSAKRGESVEFNNEWFQLGKELGFDANTMEPVTGKGRLFFTAEPVEQ